VFDDDAAFTALAGLTGFSLTAPARGVVFENQALLHDGTTQKLWDGTTARDVGFVRPSSVTALGVAAGPGVTGTYAAKYTWYDQTHDHDSSPSTATADQAYTNEQRVHTKPGGAPPAHVTHWRVWVRKSTETFYGLVGTVAIGTTTLTEGILDDARVLTILGGESDNDPPSIVPAVMGVHLGYGIAFPADSATMHVSKEGDIESWPPRRVFKIGAEDGEPVRLAKSFGEEFVIMKPHRAFRLVGTQIPFEPTPITGSFGAVSQEAGIEVGDWFYAWDRKRGPYRTNLVEWVPLADYRLGESVSQVNGEELDGIRAVHWEALSLVIWSVPVTGSARKRTLLAYHYGLNTWLPPMTGMEYHSLATYTQDGVDRLVFGDYWGRVHALFEGHRDGPTTGSIRGTVTSATTTVLTDTAATFPTTGAGLAGCPVAVRSPSGAWQWRRIASNTATALTLDSTHALPFNGAPVVGAYYLVGGIEWRWSTPFQNFGAPFHQKRLHWLLVDFKPTGNYTVEARARFDRALAVRTSLSFASDNDGGIWGSMVWGQSTWGASGVSGRKARIQRACVSVQLQFSNFEPDQAIEIARYSIEGDVLAARRVGN
jgi:hypothetical protein